MQDASWRDLFRAGKAATLALISLGIWLNAADSLVTSTVMPSIARDIGGFAYFAWPVAAYALGAIVGGAFAGWASHAYGLKGSLMVSALIYALGCAASALSPTMGVFICGRLLQGLGAGVVVGACYFAINALFPAELWRRVLAVLSGVWGVATLLGPLLGGLFAQGHAWRLLFWFFAAQAAAFSLAAFLLVPRNATEAMSRAIPVRTLVLIVAGIACILRADVIADVLSSGVLTLAGVFLLLAAFRLDRSARARLFPPEIADLTSPSGLGYASIFLFSLASVAFTVYGAAILQSLYGLSPLEAGYVIAIEAMAWTIAALVVSDLPQARDRLCIRSGTALIAISVACLIVVLPSGSLVFVALNAALLGAGFGISWAYFSRHIVSNLPQDERSIGASAIPVAQLVGSAVGSAISGLVANALGAGSGIGGTNAGSIGRWLFIVALPIALGGLLGSWRATAHARASVLAEA